MSMIHAAVSTAQPEQLASIDLNLLVAFDALVRERSVTVAAERMGVTQSAMSHALRRLRELFGDPLLVRGPRGMALTPRAESLSVPLRSGLTTLSRALAMPDGFEPQSAQRAFCIASPDLFDVLVVPPLLTRIREEAPGVDLRIISAQERTFPSQLESGEVDYAIVPRVDGGKQALPGGLLQRTLFRDRMVCLMRRDHPCLRQRVRGRKKTPSGLSLEAYAALSHLLVSPRASGAGLVDDELARHGLARRIVLRVPHFYSALAILSGSDLVCTAPSALAALAHPHFPLAALPPPVELPGHSVNLVWHERFSRDPGHLWLRKLLIEVARSVEARFR